MSAIITVDQLQDINPAVTETVGALVADAVNAWIETSTSRCWGETKTVTERYTASRVVWLRHMDVTGIVAIRTGYPGDQQTTLATTDYYVTREGRLTLKSWGRRSEVDDYLEIEYTYGVPEADVPSDLLLAGLGIANGYYGWVTNGGREVSRAQVGSYTVQYATGGGEQPGTAATVTRDTQVVNAYALRRV